MKVFGYQLFKGFLLIVLSYLLFVRPDFSHISLIIQNVLHNTLTMVGYFNLKISQEAVFIPLTSVGMAGLGVALKSRKFPIVNELNQTKPVKLEDLLGKIGKIKSINGERFVSVEHKLFTYTTQDKTERMLGRDYIVLGFDGDTLII